MSYPDNDYPNPDNFPVVSFRSPIPAPLVDPTEPDFIYVGYNVYWAEALGGAAQALLQPCTWQGDHDEVIQAQNRANNLLVLLQTPAEVASGQSPFWDDPDAADADGSSSDNTYTFSEQIQDWAIAAFVAASGVPGAAVSYLTIAPRFRLAFKTRDWGGIAKIFIDDVLVDTVDTYSLEPGQIFRDIIIS